MTCCYYRAAVLLLVLGSTSVLAQQPPAAPSAAKNRQAQQQQELPADARERELFDSFSKTFTDAVLVGHFTVLGDETKSLHEERYEIRRVTKMNAGDYWLFHARIKYGEHDVTVPLPLEVKWAGETPLITVNQVTIPALGTFDAKVVIDGDRYAGIWRHDKVGGHLFGKIEKNPGAVDQKDQTDPSGPSGVD